MLALQVTFGGDEVKKGSGSFKDWGVQDKARIAVHWEDEDPVGKTTGTIKAFNATQGDQGQGAIVTWTPDDGTLTFGTFLSSVCETWMVRLAEALAQAPAVRSMQWLVQ